MTEKFSQRQTLFFEFDPSSWNQPTLTLPQKICWCGRLGQVPQPRLASSHWLGHLPSLASPVTSLLYKKKPIRQGGKEDPGRKVKVLWFHKVFRFQFWSNSKNKVHRCHGSVIFMRSYSFGHLDSVKWLTLILNILYTFIVGCWGVFFVDVIV